MGWDSHLQDRREGNQSQSPSWGLQVWPAPPSRHPGPSASCWLLELFMLSVEWESFLLRGRRFIGLAKHIRKKNNRNRFLRASRVTEVKEEHVLQCQVVLSFYSFHQLLQDMSNTRTNVRERLADSWGWCNKFKLQFSHHQIESLIKLYSHTRLGAGLSKNENSVQWNVNLCWVPQVRHCPRACRTPGG